MTQKTVIFIATAVSTSDLIKESVSKTELNLLPTFKENQT
jgi:hypothetical protein